MKGFLWGTLTLAVMQVVLQQGAAANISGGLTKANTALTWFLSPDKPLIRNYGTGLPANAATPVSPTINSGITNALTSISAMDLGTGALAGGAVAVKK